MNPVKSILVDRTNFATLAPRIISEMRGASLIGLDCETHDDGRHEGLNTLCNYHPQTRKKAKNSKTVFDTRRTTLCGFSIYVDGADQAYYINVNHADVQNRVPWDEAKALIQAKPSEAHWVIHNAPFELMVFGKELLGEKLICTLQQCVSAYGPDEYSVDDFVGAGLGGIGKLIPEMFQVTPGYQGLDMTPAQEELLQKIVGKASTAAHSYNGFVNDITYGYSLKKAVKSWFGHQMTTYWECLGDAAHMGELTGQQVVAYGADDAYWAVQLHKKVLAWMLRVCPSSVIACFTQEQPMVPVYADIWTGGLKVNHEAITDRRAQERHNAAAVLRRLRAAVQKLLPFPTELHAKLRERDNWYFKNGDSYRAKIVAWANASDRLDDFQEVSSIRGPVSNAWASELGRPEPQGPNFTHYMPVRVLMYDLLGQKLIVSEGKTQSDGEARGKLKDRLTDPVHVEVIDCLTELAGIEQRMKLYLTPYEQLTDPETSRLYPVVTSMLASRRMASSNPNGMQLAKRGESTYVRGFFEADNDDHVVVSIDWSAIELVEIGDFSGDPGFAEAYSTIPHQDLHSRAAAALLKVETGVDVPLATFKRLPVMTKEEGLDIFGPKAFINFKGQQMTPSDAYKYHRGNDGGKGANFNYWYSGALGTIGDKRGWTSEQMWAAVEAYRAEFPVAEQWRVETIATGQNQGFIMLPDGHRRTRYEATQAWENLFKAKFITARDPSFQAFVDKICRKIQTRAKNQIVNSLIQGSCATIAKRSIVSILKACKDHDWDVRFMMPIHDELVFSVHRSIVVEFIKLAKGIMCSHPDIIKTLKLDASPAVGRTFEPFNLKKAPFGQVELNEAPLIPGVLGQDTLQQRLSDDKIQEVVEYLLDRTHLKVAA